jgi:hypothetical protein
MKEKKREIRQQLIVRIQKTRVIWMSLTGALGIEGYRLMINKDMFYADE